ncbi:MAG TPA: anti-sigma factor, partial [Anaerolineales bacterium]|nr:anti-sigma factor [Anaerolineales bacterium]
PAYMSPEQARGDLTDGRTDIYSLGIVLYEILAGHLPFEGETTMGVLMKHINEPPPAVPGLPPKMQYVLDRALAKSVDDRFQTPAEFGQAFVAAMENKDDYSTLDMFSAMPVKRPAKKIFGQKKSPRWIAPAVAAVVVVALGGSLFLRGTFAPAASTSTPSSTVTLTELPPSATSTITRTSTPAILLGRTAVLHFENGSALVDQISLVAEAILAPPEGNQYEVWLVNGNQRISVGILKVDANGKGILTFKQEQGANLLSLYNAVEVTIEPNPDPSARTTGIIAYSFTLPADGLTHVRYLLSSFPTTPDQKALVEGLFTSVQAIDELANEMQDALEAGDNERVLEMTESIHSIIVGNQSPNYQDLNNNGEVDDPGDGFGLLLNGRNLGYLPAVYSEAEATVSSAGASQPMLTHGQGLKTSVENLALWTPELQNLVTSILNSPSGSDVKQSVAEVAALADKMLNGIDVDQDGAITPRSGESGAQVAYSEAYHMADMPLQAVGILNLGTGTPTFITVPQTSSGDGGGDSSSNNGAKPTQRPKNTPKPPNDNKPPDKPKNDNADNTSNEPNENKP